MKRCVWLAAWTAFAMSAIRWIYANAGDIAARSRCLGLDMPPISLQEMTISSGFEQVFVRLFEVATEERAA